MDSVFSWAFATCLAWYGSYRFFLTIVEAYEKRKARNRAEWDEMW